MSAVAREKLCGLRRVSTDKLNGRLLSGWGDIKRQPHHPTCSCHIVEGVGHDHLWGCGGLWGGGDWRKLVVMRGHTLRLLLLLLVLCRLGGGSRDKELVLSVQEVHMALGDPHIHWSVLRHKGHRGGLNRDCGQDLDWGEGRQHDLWLRLVLGQL